MGRLSWMIQVGQGNHKGPYKEKTGRFTEEDAMTAAEVGMWGHDSRCTGGLLKLEKARKQILL